MRSAATLRCLALGTNLALCFRSPERRCSLSEAWGLRVLPGSPCRRPRLETTGSPRFLLGPNGTAPRSLTPGGPPCLARAASRCCRRLDRGRRLPQIVRFRGSVTRPCHSLSTLRVEGYPKPRKTRFRVAATLFRVGLVTHWAHLKGFSSALCHRIPLSQASPGAPVLRS